MTETVQEMAFRLARADRNLRRSLVEKRRERNLTQADIARRIGVTLDWVRRIERYDSDPRMSDMRRYQCAVYAEDSDARGRVPRV